MDRVGCRGDGARRVSRCNGDCLDGLAGVDLNRTTEHRRSACYWCASVGRIVHSGRGCRIRQGYLLDRRVGSRRRSKRGWRYRSQRSKVFYQRAGSCLIPYIGLKFSDDCNRTNGKGRSAGAVHPRCLPGAIECYRCVNCITYEEVDISLRGLPSVIQNSRGECYGCSVDRWVGTGGQGSRGDRTQSATAFADARARSTSRHFPLKLCKSHCRRPARSIVREGGRGAHTTA